MSEDGSLSTGWLNCVLNLMWVSEEGRLSTGWLNMRPNSSLVRRGGRLSIGGMAEAVLNSIKEGGRDLKRMGLRILGLTFKTLIERGSSRGQSPQIYSSSSLER